MNWIQRKIYLYNVTFGLYMLDWWERYLFSILLFDSSLNDIICLFPCLILAQSILKSHKFINMHVAFVFIIQFAQNKRNLVEICERFLKVFANVALLILHL